VRSVVICREEHRSVADLIVSIKKRPDEDGSVVKITPESAGWEYVGFEVLRLEDGRAVERRADAEEVCLVVLSGYCTISTPDGEWKGIGERDSVFEGRPYAVYLPPGTAYRIEAVTYLELAVASAPALRGTTPFDPLLVRPEDIEVEVRGSGNMERRIHPILMEDRPAERLLVVEVVTPQGHWSSYPPHKHDEDDLPNESYLEETYYHKIQPSHGFALQRVYTEDRSLDETLTVDDDDTVLVPHGYHAVSAPPGYDLYYLNVMAGPVREWKVKNDPDHEWLLG
jgi:5-deoxy-glucuronate isomerase